MDDDVVSGAGRLRRMRWLEFFSGRMPTSPDSHGEPPSTESTEGPPAVHAKVGPTGEQILHGHTDGVSTATFSPDGQLLATASYDNTARIWDLAAGTTLHVLTGHHSGAYVVRFAPDGHLLASTDWNTVRLWDVTNGQCVRVLDHAIARGVHSVAFSPDGRQLATTDGRVLIWDLHSDRPPKPLTHATSEAWRVAYSKDGRYLAAISASNAVLWNATTHERLREMSRPGRLGPLAFDPSGTLLARACGRETWAWDVASGEERTEFSGIHRDDVIDLAFSPDGRRLATAGWDNQVGLWDAATGAALDRLIGHIKPVVSVEYSPDGGLLATAGLDHVVRIWSTARPGAGLSQELQP